MERTKEQKLFQTIVKRAWEDNAFKQELIASPLNAIENLTGERIKLPEGKTIVVRDQTNESVVYINIPAEANMDDMELNEEQLEIIAGGGSLPGAVLQNSTDPLNGLVGG
ncbi:MAG: NHLP leader peptide family RiPP precursor [Flavobacteriaceae bacterium]|nr:NHLP leader peptide family RiPP precursor [Flavobacteriaceae bacterium]